MALTPPRDAARGLIQEDSLLDEALSIESTASVAFKFTVSTRTDSLQRTRFSITSCAIQFPRHDPLSFQIGYPTQTDTISTEPRSEEHTSELQSLMRNSYAVFCLKKKTHIKHKTQNHQT